MLMDFGLQLSFSYDMLPLTPTLNIFTETCNHVRRYCVITPHSQEAIPTDVSVAFCSRENRPPSTSGCNCLLCQWPTPHGRHNCHRDSGRRNTTIPLHSLRSHLLLEPRARGAIEAPSSRRRAALESVGRLEWDHSSSDCAQWGAVIRPFNGITPTNKCPWDTLEMMLFTKDLIKWKRIGRISWKFWYRFIS